MIHVSPDENGLRKEKRIILSSVFSYEAILWSTPSTVMFPALAIARSSVSLSRIACSSARAFSALSDTSSFDANRRRRLRKSTDPPADISPSSILPASSAEAPSPFPETTQDDSIDRPKGEDDRFEFLNNFFKEAAQAQEDLAMAAFKYRPYLPIHPENSPHEPLKAVLNLKPGRLLVEYPVVLEQTPYIKIVANGPLTRKYIDDTFAEVAIRIKSVCLLSQYAPDETFDLGRFIFQVELSSVRNLHKAIGIHWPHFEVISAHLAEEHTGFATRKSMPFNMNRISGPGPSMLDMYLQDELEFEKIPAATRLPTTDPMNVLPLGSHGCHIKIISNQHLDYTHLRTLFGRAEPSIPIYAMWNLPSIEPSALCLKRRYFCMVQLGSLTDLFIALKLDMPSCKIISIHFNENLTS